MMIKDSAIAAFKERNKESDVMGVVRTLLPDVKINMQKSSRKKKKS